jgi:hypothetical protein
LPLRHYDSVKLEDGGTMIDTIELRFLGVVVGRVAMRLMRVPGSESTLAG